MKLLRLILALFILTICTVAFGADAVAVAPAPSIMEWFIVNKAAVFGAALALSELLSLIPGFQGNGILDTIKKALVQLSGKPSVNG